MRRYLLISALLLLANSVAGADVPQFRGPGGSGVSKETGLPTHWSEKENIRWKVVLPGRGLSNPVIANGRVYVTACSGPEQTRLHILCFDQASGKRLWERQFWATGTTLCHPKTNMAAPTPVTDGKHVFALFATADLFCLDADGTLVWYRSLTGDYPTIGNNVGMAASPILWRDVLLVCLENVGDSFAAGFDKQTGENRWRIPRPRGINWVTPLLIDNKGQAEVLFQDGAELSAHDPATGQKRWSLRQGGTTIPSPVFADGLIFAPGGKFHVLQPGSLKEKPKVVWESPKLSTGYASPLIYRGVVYTLNHRGILNCADAATGKHLGNHRLEGTYAASPLAADGKIYAVSEDGVTTVLEAGPEAKVLSVNSLPETILASPVAAGGCLFLRSDKHLYCIGEAKK
jgi:outer membrane protein assembly factor BamB